MPSIAVWLFPGTGLYGNPCHWCTTYRPYEQYSDCSQAPSQIDAPAYCSRFGWWVVNGLVVDTILLLHKRGKRFKVQI